MAEVSIDAPSKACTRCREVKAATVEFFSPKRAAADGLQVWCKACCAEQKREYRRRCPDNVRASRARYEATHGDAIKAQQRASHLKHREQRLAAMRTYWQRVGPERKEAERRMRATSPAYRELRLEELRRWKAKDPERFRRLRAEWWQRRTPAQKLRTRLSNAMRDSLKGRRKGQPWQDLLGYTAADLKLHLERQFLNGMTWENHGAVWHVDHIVPVAVFNIEGTDCPEFRACWAMTNLRPLWAEDNLTKKAQRTLLL